MRIAVCIGSVRPTTLPAAIDAIRRQTWQDWELVVIGQGADPALGELGRRYATSDARIRYIHLDQYGLSNARNAGIAATTAEIIAFTDDDCEAHSEWLSVIARCFTEHPEIGVVSGSLIAPPSAHRRFTTCPAYTATEAIYDPSLVPRTVPLGWDWLGANFAIRRTLVTQVGMFDIHLGSGTEFPSGEDTDYKLRCEELNIRMLSTPMSIVYHTFGSRQGLREVMRSQRNYATGNGALAAKLTLQGDKRGREWIEAGRQTVIMDLRRGHVLAAAKGTVRYWHYWQGYQNCSRNYHYDDSQHMLIRNS